MDKLRELIILRHGKSDWKTSADDFDRPLADRGKKAANKIHRWLSEEMLFPDLVLCSPAKRAMQTLKRVCPEAKANTLFDPELYLADLPTLLTRLAEVQNASRVMLIGHNPGLESLVSYLQATELPSSQQQDTKLFPTAALAHFIMPSSWQNLEPGAGKLANFIYPRNLTFKNTP